MSRFLQDKEVQLLLKKPRNAKACQRNLKFVSRNLANQMAGALPNDNRDWNDFQMSFKVIKSGANRKLVYDFLLILRYMATFRFSIAR